MNSKQITQSRSKLNKSCLPLPSKNTTLLWIKRPTKSPPTRTKSTTLQTRSIELKWSSWMWAGNQWWWAWRLWPPRRIRNYTNFFRISTASINSPTEVISSIEIQYSSKKWSTIWEMMGSFLRMRLEIAKRCFTLNSSSGGWTQLSANFKRYSILSQLPLMKILKPCSSKRVRLFC